MAHAEAIGRARPLASIPAPRAWLGRELADADFIVKLTPECMAELEGVIAEQRKAPVPTLILAPEHFKLDACRRLMQDVKRRLDPKWLLGRGTLFPVPSA